MWLWGLALSGCAVPDAPTAEVPPTAGEPGTRWSDPVVDSLRQGVVGWRIREGWFRRLTVGDCGPVVAQVGTCMGNNPLAPYLAPTFPEDERLDEPIGAFQLGPDEAVVMVGYTPPGRYFSYQAHLHSRVYEGERRHIVSTLARSLHHRNLAHGGSGPEAFDAYTAIVWAANRTVAERVRVGLDARLQALGLDRDVVNVVELPFLSEADRMSTAMDPAYGDITVTPLWMGYGPDDDEYGIAVRIAGVPDDDPYLEAGRTPMAVFKVGFDDPPAYDPFAYPLLPPPRDPSSGPSPAFEASVQAVRNAVIARLDAWEVLSVRFNTLDLDGFRCCDRGLDCGNSDDALYMQSIGARLIGSARGGVVAVGAVHPALPEIEAGAVRLAYSGLALRNVDQRMGVSGAYDELLRGSANAAFPDGVEGVPAEHLERIYVHVFTPDCASAPLPGAPCLPIGPGPLEVPPGHQFNLTERAYLDLATLTGPHDDTIIAPWSVFWGDELTLDPTQLVVVLE